MTLTALSLTALLTLGCKGGDDAPADDTAVETDTDTDTDSDTDTDTDNDGDGYNSDTDCDDDNSLVNPGATEIWYDGTDQDCDGNDDDQDGDTYAGPASADDCDDTDASVNPGAAEVWYDGVDQDCDGNDSDQDGDGVDALSEGGDDCVDTDAGIYPGATDTWYDGIDSDCAGNDDYDADGDGEQGDGGPDCDDTDPAVNTSATDTWYDGVDSDCSGGSDYDADGDGHDSDSFGGDDCADDDSSVSPSATETWYDGTDQDCDDASDYDADGDGYDSDSHGGDDCDDTDAAINPAGTEIEDDGIDQDCDGEDATSGPPGVDTLAEGDLIITEIMQNPAAVNDTDGEYFEFYNNSGLEIDLDGLLVYDDGSNSFSVAGELIVAAGAYVVFGVNDDAGTNGGVTVDYDYGSSMSLGNSDDELYLANTTGSVVFDSVSWDDGATFPDPSGYSMNLDETYAEVDANDYGYHWCDASSTYGDGDYGTPGSANDDCGFTYAYSDVQSIWDASCTSCHGGGSPSASLPLDGDWSDIVNVASGQLGTMDLIEPGDSANSYLYLKVAGGYDTAGGSGSAMPRGGSSLSSTNLAIIETWIDEGAVQ